MKALIISEDQNVYDALNTALINAGYDTIIYKWLLKALDNIEEIRPDCIVVSSSEYPRHWKTLVQFVKSGIGGDNTDVYLYEPQPMSAEDEEKARVLGITDYFSSLEPEVLEGIFGKEVKEEEPVPEPIAQVEIPAEDPAPVVVEAPAVVETPAEPEPVPAPVVEDSVPEEEYHEESIPTVIVEDKPEEEAASVLCNTGHFMLTHPVTSKFVAGKFFDYNGKTMSCSFQDINDIADFEKGMAIEYFTFFDSRTTKNSNAIVNDIVSISKDNTFVIIEIQNIYEEN